MSVLFSRQCEYALQAVLYLALKPEGVKTSIRDLAKRIQIPHHFLAKILQQLVYKGMLVSQKGPAGGFALAEAGLWVLYAVYTSKGNNQTDLFQSFAAGHWSAVKYAEWIETNVSKLNPDVNGFSGYMIPGTEGRPPWERVDWSKINAVESQIAQRSGNGFTHLLPRRPEQQYFELIGKYPQFAAGWDDAGLMTPERILASDVSARFLEYSAMRGRANDFYNMATTGTALIIVNHVLSALDAAWSASQYNNRFRLETHLRPIQRSDGFVEMVPTASVTIRF